MNLAEVLLPALPSRSGVVAFVGAGGKTTAMFRLARELAESGRPVLVTTTTHLLDPRLNPGTPPCTLVFRPETGLPFAGERGAPARDGITLLLSREADEAGKVVGVHPSWVPALATSWPFVLVEADGSKGLPVKVPASHEPVLPPGTDLVVGVVGLAALGRPMDGRTVHRPELFTRVAGCSPGTPISWAHLVALARHPDGLFKGAPPNRAVLLARTTDDVPLPSAEQLRELGADRVVVCGPGASGEIIVVVRDEAPSCR